MKKYAIAALIPSAITVAQPAYAAKWNLEFEGQYWAYDNAEGFELVKTSAVLTTEDELSSDWSNTGYRILDITGTRNGVKIVDMDRNSSFMFDGPLNWPNYPYLDTDPFRFLGDFGFSFKTADNIWYNLNSFGDFDGNNGSERQRDPKDPAGLFIVQIGTLDITRVAGVPEPATWAMMILGFGLVGAALRRRNGALATA
ncbi:hypothetical protein ASG29_15655 [Sphingomonas sp. Leaf412]|uniref:PEPxxWA-CTERM sorting domain-containing protein n=1 Tax=Sphingomonas sp. Leaf412 TaxID=1736370 RepID=UPI0006F6AFB4|nr:PEPxxWA-CTERM sorting domain-containing protein [Sphingomonas sp. Leaf412]KQT31377.1 hypothetical protein ASG29_15655 [Sphingomonas sp. Leaf412]